MSEPSQEASSSSVLMEAVATMVLLEVVAFAQRLGGAGVVGVVSHVALEHLSVIIKIF